MSDLLVRLYDLPTHLPRMPEGVVVRRALAPERRQVVEWVARMFHSRWASECEFAFSTHPVAIWIAVRTERVVGFACHDGIAKGFFGPTGVDESERGQGIGEALLFATLHGMREAGYAYAIIGWPGPVDFYKKRTKAIEIPESTPGAYRGLLPIK
jgi:GNAT superfamily N-acetyltransferase